MTLEELYQQGFQDGLEKVAEAEDEGIEAQAGWLKTLKAKRAKGLLALAKKKGAKVGFKDLSAGRKVGGLGALLAAAVGGRGLGKKRAA